MESRHMKRSRPGAAAGHTLNYYDPISGEHIEIEFGELHTRGEGPTEEVAYLTHDGVLVVALPAEVMRLALRYGWSGECPNVDA